MLPVGTATVCGVVGVPGLSAVVAPLVDELVTNTVPWPSSLIVAIPALFAVITLSAPPVLVAVNVNVSLLSDVVSLTIATRTNKFAVSLVLSASTGIFTKLPGVYATQAAPFQYSKAVPVSVPRPASISALLLVLPNANFTY